MALGKIKNQSLLKILNLMAMSIDNREILSIDQIIAYLGCCKGTAYQYQRALRWMFPKGHFQTREDIERERQRGQQQCLI